MDGLMETPPSKPDRLQSLDTFRGFAMFLMAMELLRLPQLAEHFSFSAIWRMIGFHSDHVVWTGCSLHDLIQPAFSFMVGMALPFSIASRQARGQTNQAMLTHALWRAFILVAIGVVLRFIDVRHLHLTFEDTLAQIGLGYPLLFLLGLKSSRVRWSALLAILVGYWLLFALYPLPGPGFDRVDAGIPEDWNRHFTGFAAHWNLNSNGAWAFDRWFLNLFPFSDGFTGNPEGYSTLSFIPTLGTMVIGLIAGQWFKSGPRGIPLMVKLITCGSIMLALGVLLHEAGICPIVKKLWTPSWTLLSGGWCLFLMAAFHGINDVAKKNFWSYPLRVLGMNSITMYILTHLTESFLTPGHRLYLERSPFDVFGKVLQPTLHGAMLLITLWCILWVLYRRRIFLRI